MTAGGGLSRTRDDIEWAANFGSINSLLNNCGTNSEKAALLLSTCRNAYLTVNALFVDLQVLMGDAVEPSELRAGCELMLQGVDAALIKKRFARAMQTVHEFESKCEVWDQREVIWKVIENSKETLESVDLLASSRIDLVLQTPRIPSQDVGDGWEYEVLALNLEPRTHLQSSFQALDRIFSVLKGSAELGLQAMTLLDRDPQAQLILDDVVKESDSTVSFDQLPGLIKSLVGACGWHIVEGNNSLSIQFSGGYERPQSAPSCEEIVLAAVTSIETLKSAKRSLGALIREALYFAHSEMRKSFEPNVAKPPMPAPFSIALNPQYPIRDVGRGQPLNFTRIRCATQPTIGDSVRIALGHLAVPSAKIDWQRYQLKDDVAEQVKQDIRCAIQTAKNQGCKAIAFPEYSVPSSMEEELMKLANQHQIIIIAGLDGKFLDGKLCDQAIIAIPHEKTAYCQRKQVPSLEEEADAAFYRDGEFLFFSNSPVGDFAVILCSDVLQLDAVQVWNADRPLPELLFIIARNKYTQLYEDIAKGDSMRLYSSIAICNVCDVGEEATSEGSCVIVPRRDGGQMLPLESVEVDGKFLRRIGVADISLRAIRARSRGKPDPGYFAVPPTAKRS